MIELATENIHGIKSYNDVENEIKAYYDKISEKNKSNFAYFLHCIIFKRG